MAYANLVNLTVANKAEFFGRFRDFVCKRNGKYDYSSNGIGWTLWDSSYAVNEDNPQLNDWFVIFSPGQSGSEDLYMQVQWISGYFTIKGYLSWDPTTHAGTTSYAYGTANSLTFADAASNPTMSIFGDLDHIAVMNSFGGDDYGTSFGYCEPAVSGIDTDTAISSASASAGSNVVITLDAVPSGWEVGTNVVVRTVHTNDVSTAKIEYTEISAISGNNVTVDLTYSYTAGFKVSAWNCYVTGNNQMASSLYPLIVPNGSYGLVNQTGNSAALSIGSSNNDPTYYEGLYVMTDWVFQVATYGWPLFFVPMYKNLMVITSPMVTNDTVVDRNGVYWRCKKCFSLKYMAFKEV